MSTELAGACPRCGVVAPIEDRFCEVCGSRLAPVADGATDPGDRSEIDAGVAAGLTHPGLVRATNQDALYLERTGGSVVAVVCDGVSTSVDAAAAARVACTAAGRTLSQPDVRTESTVRMRAATMHAQRAVRALGHEDSSPLAAPACTLVAAVWNGRVITIGSAGDSRAYWVDGDSALTLTRDDSWAREQVELGLMNREDAEADRRAHEITHWIGAGSPDEPPTVTTFVPERRGLLAVCTDGLWNYLSSPHDFGSRVRHVGDRTPPLIIARSLVAHALAAGGRDNITIAIVEVVPDETRRRDTSGTPEDMRQ